VQYFDPPDSGDEEIYSPFYLDPDHVTDELREKLAPSRERWFSGQPSPLATLVRGFVAVVPRVIDRIAAHYRSADGGLELRDWYATVPPISTLAKAHDFDCRRNDCDLRLAHVDPDDRQAWVARYYDSDLAVRVIPCEWLWCEVE
jgi:hypothetical protein